MKSAQVELRPLDRSNVMAMLALRVRPEQERFVASPAKSIAACYVREYGDNFEYTPLVICAGQRVVGYVTIMCDPKTGDDYWVDDIMIEASEQGRGYGKSAVVESVKKILARYPRCRAVQLTCFRGNDLAAAVYRKVGFRVSGRLNPINGEPQYELIAAALDAYRER